MKLKRLYLLVMALMFAIFSGGCKSHVLIEATTTSEAQSDVQETEIATTTEVQGNIHGTETTTIEMQSEVQETTKISNQLNDFQEEIHIESSIETYNQELSIVKANDVLPRVIDNDYSKAYAKALFDGAKIPSEEAYNLMRENESLIENEPRLVVDCNESIHIIWTNKEMFLVIDGNETDLKVSDCIYADELPELPEKLEILEEYHKFNEQVRFGIAEEAYLQALYSRLREVRLEINGLHRVRFYNHNGKATAVYSLEKNGKLYIDEYVAQEILN